MHRKSTPRPRTPRTTTADPPPAPKDTSGWMTCDGCERRATCGIDEPPDPIQEWLWDQEHPITTPTTH